MSAYFVDGSSAFYSATLTTTPQHAKVFEALAYTNGSVVSCAVTGCCATPDVLWADADMPVAVTGDANAVYFVTYAKGTVWKVAKP